ncbi:sulfite exporter TauE/SafE family protein [Radiobacillus deserti]|uniref:Probable membrane transporter protein n=1 Tax=Radiobacillus deserti TaxID=2594883 RepID=A0A516KER7_9BACI|nr:sulfite exporter TauE/SafE family protein [Radiobacillus deserti]QDP39880.1 sulfite exporter TauE/SafE family protein [Radiobacillus deserti]
MFELSVIQWGVVLTCAMFIGFTKTGISSLGILVVTALMLIFPAKESVGILLPLLIIGDIFAVVYYRRSVVWKYLFSLVPWVLIGIIAGYFVLDEVSSEQLKPMIGILVLALIVLQISREKFGESFNQALPKAMWFTIAMGGLAGFATMIGNAAGGVMAIYLLVKELPKKEFVGTGAWFFLFVNVIKVPFYVQLDLITFDSLAFNVWLVPSIVIGAVIGIKLLPKIPQKTFHVLILTFTALGAIRLLF